VRVFVVQRVVKIKKKLMTNVLNDVLLYWVSKLYSGNIWKFISFY